MSDFGVTVQIFRKDGEDVTDEDREEISHLIEEFREAEDLANHLGDPFEYDIREAENDQGAQGVAVLLSEYWFDDVRTSDTNVEDIVEEDRETAESFSTTLTDTLGDRFEIEVVGGEW